MIVRQGLRGSTAARKGLSLLEVLVALAIFLFSFVAIGQIIDYASRRAVELDLRSQAALLAQSKLAEVVAGAVPLTSQSEMPFDEDADWNWSLEATADEVPGLYKVQVTVSRDYPGGLHVQVVLDQMVLDPTKRGGTDASTLGTDDTSTTTGTTPSTTTGSP